MNTLWKKVPLGEVMTKSQERVEINPDTIYKQVTIRLWGKGVKLRNKAAGYEIRAKNRFLIRPNQFILSRIDARHGAFGLVPDKLDGAVVSSDFPVFDLNTLIIEPHFLKWLSKTNGFVELAQAASEGTTNRVRLKEDRFLSIEIPLPQLSEQRRIVARIEELAAKIEEANGLRFKSAKSVDFAIEAALSNILKEHTKDPNWRHVPIQAFVQVNPKRENVTLRSEDLVSFVPMAAVDKARGTIACPEDRPYSQVAKGYTYFKYGDVIFARITPCMQNGKAAIAYGLTNGIGFGSTEFYVLRPGPEITSEWLHIIVRSKDFRRDAEGHFKGTAGQQRVPVTFLRNKIIPVPPVSDQHRIVAYLDTLQAKVNDLKRLQEQTTAEMYALLPSILDKAFKGEL